MPVNNPRHSRFFWRSAAMFGILDFERRFKEVNAAWEVTLGLSTGQLLAKIFLELVHPEDQPSTQYYFEQLEAGMTSVSFSCRFRHYDSSYHHILWDINNAASVEYAYYIVGMDITSREQPMIADEMLSVLQEGVVLQYANGTIGICNHSAERILGIPSEQMMGWTLVDPDWKIIHEDGSPFPLKTHPAICTLRTGQPYSDVVMGIVKPDDTTTWIRVNSHPLWRDDVTTPYAVVISFSNVTQYKENELHSQNEPVNSIISENDYDLWDWNLLNNEVNFSARWKQMLGLETTVANHVDTWHQRIHPADYKRLMVDIQNHIDGMTPTLENTHRLQHSDGSYHWILCRAVVVKDNAGKPSRIIGTHVDVTEPHRMEDEVKETEKKYRQLLETETNAIILIDAETQAIIEINKATTQLYGYSSNQLLEMKKVDLLAQPEKGDKSFKRGMKHTTRQYHKKQDGSVFLVEVTTSPFVWNNRHSFMTIIRDITEQQRLESTLWENESKYRQLFEAASSPTIVFDANTQQFFDANRAAIDLYGYTKEEFLQKSTDDVSAEPAKNRTAFSGGGKKVQLIPLRWHKKKDGTVFPVEISTGSSYLFQGRSLVCATVRDITERKAHEEAIRKERDFINNLVQASPAYFIAINPNGTIRMMNTAILTALEYQIEEIIGVNYLEQLVQESERPIVSTEFQTLIKSMQPSLMEYHIISKTGKMLLVEWHSRSIVTANGALDYLFSVGIDVTERKKAQSHLRLFKSIIESSAESIAIRDHRNELVYVNPAYERLFGRSFKEAKQIPLHEYFPINTLEVFEKQVVPALAKGNSWEGELDVYDRDNEIFPIWERVDAVRDSEKKLLFSFGLMHDISERQRMWETLRQQWEEHQTIFNTIPAMIWYKDSENNLSRSNQLATDTFGPETRHIKKLINCEEIIQLGHPQHNLLETYQNVAGENIWLQISKIPLKNQQRTTTGAIVFAIDVTEYKQTNHSLQTSEERLYLVVENMPIMLNAFDTDGNIVMWNRACETVTGYRADEVIGNTKIIEKLYPDSTERNRLLARWYSVESGQNRWETKIVCRDGRLKSIAWHSVAKEYPIPGWYTWHIGHDITEDKQHEKKSREQEVLLAAALEATKLGICFTDDRGRFLQVNRAYAELHGYRPEEMIGQPFTLILPSSAHGEAVRNYYNLLMTQDEPTIVRQQSETHRTGKQINVQIMASRIILEDRRRLLISIISM